MKRYIVVFTAILVASIVFQAWFLGLTPHGVQLGDPKLSTAYTEALAHGQSYLLTNPDPRLLAAKDPFGPATAALMIWDTSFYRGHFYMYFGIVPFVVFMLPWMKLTGAAPSPELAILVFSVIGYLAYGGILLIAIRRHFSKAPWFLAVAAFITVIVASGTWPLMGRPAIFEIENAAAYAFLGLSLLALVRYEIDGIKSEKLLVMAAGLAGLTMGCRPNYFPAVTVIGAWTLLRSWTNNRKEKFATLTAFAPLLALSIVGIALGYWNYQRFGNPFDFGLKHTVSDDPTLARPLSSWANLPYHLHRYALGMPRLDQYFPFIQGQREGPFILTKSQEISNQVYGFLIITPILCAAPIAFFRLNAKNRTLNPYCWACVALFLANFLYLSSVTMSCYRYPADFLGPLALVAAIGTLHLSEFRSKFKFPAYGAVLSLMFWSVLLLTFETFSTAQTTELFDLHRAADFKEIARPFNQLAYGYERLNGNGQTAIFLEVQLPVNRYGKSEPLVVVGDNGAQDFIYVYYSSPESIQVGFEATGLGGILSLPTKIEYNSRHKFELLLGSFLPPDDHPMFRGIAVDRIAGARQTLVVRLDGAAILRARVHFHLPRGQIFYGQSPFDAAFGSTFSGSLQSHFYRPPLSEFLDAPLPFSQ